MNELRACAGTQFDAEVVNALLIVLARPAVQAPSELIAQTGAREPASLRAASDLDGLTDAALENQLGPR